MAKAYSYLRFSTPEQLKGDSFRRQTEAAEAYAKAHGLCLDDRLTFHDLGVSAFRGSNAVDGALGQFLAAVDDGRVPAGSYLLVENLDRLSRDKIMAALNRFSALLEREINVVTLSDGKLYTAESLNNLPDLMLSLLVMSRAHEESAMKGQRLRAAWKAKKERAAKSKQALTAMAPAWLRLVDGKLEPIPERAAVVRRIFDMALAGHGKLAIARKLNEGGVPTFGAPNGWYDSYVAKILANEAVIGRFQPMRDDYSTGKRKRVPDGDPIDGYYPAVIDSADFYKVKRAPSGLSAKRPGRSPRNVLAGLTRCQFCGAAMHYVNKGGTRHGGEYLACDTHRRLGKDKCAAPAVRYEVVLTAVMDCLEDREMDLRSFLGADQAGRRAELQKALDGATAGIAEAETGVANLLDVLTRVPSPAVEKRLAETEATLASLREEKARLEAELAGVANGDDDAGELLEAIAKWRRRFEREPQEVMGELAAWLHARLGQIIKGIDVGICDDARKYIEAVASAAPLTPEQRRDYDAIMASATVSAFVGFRDRGPNDEPKRVLAIFADRNKPGRLVGLAMRDDKGSGRATVLIGKASSE